LDAFLDAKPNRLNVSVRIGSLRKQIFTNKHQPVVLFQGDFLARSNRMIAYQLSLRSLAALTAGRIVAVRIPHFLTAHEAAEIADAVSGSCHFRFTGPGFTGLGPGSFALPQSLADYTASSAEIDQILCTPFERLQGALGKLQRPVVHGDTALRPLTARRYDPAFVALPHQDEDAHRYPWAAESQLGISIGLVSPKDGGQIRLWDHAYDSYGYAERRLEGRFELDESLIPQHALAVECEVGELLVLNARRIHAIDPIKEGARTSISGFLSVSESASYIWS
jgi:hypothetical protein